MKIIITLKSHFKINNLNKQKKINKKGIFVKNITMFLLLSKILFNNFDSHITFNKKKILKTSFLKAPSRHKKFFHQISFEEFYVKIFFIFKGYLKINLLASTSFFFEILGNFSVLGSNVLTLTKLLLITNINIKNNFDLF